MSSRQGSGGASVPRGDKHHREGEEKTPWKGGHELESFYHGRVKPPAAKVAGGKEVTPAPSGRSYQKTCDSTCEEIDYDVALQRAKFRFADNVTSSVIDHLVREFSNDGVLTDSDVDSIRRSRDRLTRAFCLREMLSKKGSAATKKMLTHLWHIDGDLFQKLELPCEVILNTVKVETKRPEVCMVSTKNKIPANITGWDKGASTTAAKGAGVKDVTPGPSSSGYQKTWDLECEEIHYGVALRRAKFRFADSVSRRVTDHLLKELPNDGVLTGAEVVSIRIYRDRVNRAFRLIDTVIAKGSEACRRMLTHLWHIDGDLLCELELPFEVIQTIVKLKVTRSKLSPEYDWRKVDPSVSQCEGTPVYTLHSEAGSCECRISGLRCFCMEKASFKYQFHSWDDHKVRMEGMGYMPGGPLLAITVIKGKLDEVYLPHWIYTGDNPSILNNFAILYKDKEGDVVYPVCEVTPSHFKLSQTVLSRRALGMKFGLIAKTNCRQMIFETNKDFRPDVADRLKKLSPKDFVKFCQLVRDQVNGFPDEAEAGPVADFLLSTNYIQVAANALRNIGQQGTSTAVMIASGLDVTPGPSGSRHNTGWEKTWETEHEEIDYDVALQKAKLRFAENISTAAFSHLLQELSNDGTLTDFEVDCIRIYRERAKRALWLIDVVRTKGSKASSRMLTYLHHIDAKLLHQLDLPLDVMRTIANVKVTRREPEREDERWKKMDPVLSRIQDGTSVYSLQSKAGSFECRISGLRWTCKEKVRFRYQFGHWDQHMKRVEAMGYMPGGPLLDVTILQGKLDEVYLPHWIYTADNPAVLDKFAVLHVKPDGDVVEKASEVTPSHARLSQTAFSLKAVLVRLGLYSINCRVLIFKTDKTFLTLHVFLIPFDPALKEELKAKALSSGYIFIDKPSPTKPVKLRDHFNLCASLPTAEIQPREPETYELQYESSDPNFFEVYIEDCKQDFQLTLKNRSGSVWSCSVRKGDYGNIRTNTNPENTGDLVKYDEKLDEVRRHFVDKVNEEIINQLVDDLLSDVVLNDGETEWILGPDTRADKARRLIDTVKNKGNDASKKMISHLQHRDPTLHRELRLPQGPSV